MSDQLSSDLASLRIARDEGAPGRSPWRWFLGIGLFVALSLGVYWVGLPYLEAQIFKIEVGVTEIVTVSPAQASVELTSSGYVVPQETSKVAAKVAGKVAKVFVDQGQEVKEGDVLFMLDGIDQEAAIAASRSRAAAATARAKTAQANVAEAKIQASRSRMLAKEGVAPSSQAEDLTARVESLEAAVRAAQAEANAAYAEVKALDVGMKSLEIIAPLSGTVLNKPPEVGEFVGPQPAGISVDMGGVEIANMKSLVVETDVPEQRLHLVSLGTPAEIVLDAFPDRRYRGKTLEIVPRVNRAKATATVKVAFVDEATGALPDMSARVSFLSGELDAQAVKEPPKTIVPKAAVVEREGARMVYVIEEGKVRATPVKLGPAFGGGFELVEGPRAGTRLVKDPPPALADGKRIKERTDG